MADTGEQREQWGSRTGFLLAAVGSAVGLGNIWRFPYVAYDNGGGAFLVPYLVALLTAGIPLLVLEYTLGHRYRGSAPAVFRRLHRRAEFLGWWQIVICLVISSYYAVIVAWAVSYVGFSFGQSWGGDPEAFLFGTYLDAVDAGEVGGFRWGVAGPLLGIWVVTLGVIATGVKKGIERANKVLIPLLVVTFGVLVVRALTLEGAMDGLDALFTPDWGAMTDGSIWIAAYGQIFFSLSVGFAIMITYASYLPRRSDLTNNAFIAGFANSSFELIAGVGVFAAVGFLAASSGQAVEDAATEGLGLAFIAFPALISELPGLNSLFGVLFFGSLVFAGLSSLISITEAAVAAFSDKFGWSRQRTVATIGGATAAVSFVYATGGGVNLLDTVDNYINAFGVAVVGLVELAVVVWVLRRIRELRDHANAVSDVRLGRWWTVALGAITPIVLLVVTVDSIRLDVAEPYEGYPRGFLLLFGWGTVVAALVAAVILATLRWHRDPTSLPVPATADGRNEP
ncbi:sodium-dependent transporter [Nitriliruptoraceae bacterium ZYF776]|nr:sodium-dependent transporter [Profundirhabdus halotolerans]